MRVLVTGGGGGMGLTVAQGLRDRGQRVCVHDIKPVAGFEDCVLSDLTDLGALRLATRGMEAVIHLGGDPGGGASTNITGNDGSWGSVLNSNIIGSRNVFEAARLQSVKCVAYASRVAC
eukprot:COSAG05_NODE_1750_length_4147_cov_2.788538_2_plen_119_part_00